MAINISPVSSLIDYDFEIPNYQRGYRWDDEQVIALLNDLKDFVDTSNKGDYYCLQPVVTVAAGINNEGKERFIVVDGQQRLTTIYLIMHYFGQKCFTLQMPGRKAQEIFLQKKKFSDKEDETFQNNIDNFYLRKAYETIEFWMSQPENAEAKVYIQFLFPKEDSKHGYLAVIWHQISNREAMETFRRLNYGKIPLTAAELTKAILLQTDCYPKDEQAREKSIAQRRALEWDDMEYRLSNPLFYSMLSKKETTKNKIQGLDMVLEFVAESYNPKLKNPIIRRKREGTEDYHVFNVFDVKIKEELAAGKARNKVIERVWDDIQVAFNRLIDWYQNREWFHMIGLLRILLNTEDARFIGEIYNLGFKFVDNENGEPPKLESVSRKEFGEALRLRIKNEIKVKKAFKIQDDQKIPLPDNEQHLNSPNLNYEGKEKNKMIKILAAFNVLSVLADKEGVARFPFHLYHQHKPESLEHIHPQNISNDLNFDEMKNWLSDRIGDLNLENDIPDENERKKISDAISELEKLLVNKKVYEEEKEKALGYAATIDKVFGDMLGISEKELHSIGNMALVTGKVNSALGNKHLEKKRQVLIDYSKKSQHDPDATFIPLSTMRVFSKYYRAGNPGNIKFWQPEDRKAYKKAIQNAYEYFISDSYPEIPDL